jgi:hypothetical protein
VAERPRQRVGRVRFAPQVDAVVEAAVADEDVVDLGGTHPDDRLAPS